MNEQPTTTRKRRARTRDGLFQRNGWWCLDYYDTDGRRHRKKAAPDYNTAKIIYRNTMTAIAKGDVLGVREEGIRVRDFVDKRYWPAVKSTLAPAWAERSRGILDHEILPTFGDLKLSGLRQEPVEQWYAGRRGKVKASTANKELARLKHLLGRAIAWGYVKSNAAAKVARVKESDGRLRYLTPDEREILLNGSQETVKAKDGRAWTVDHKPNDNLRLYILAALQTGARRAELLRLRWSEVDMKRRALTFRETKNGRDRSVPMTETLREMLQKLPRPLDPAAYVLPRYAPLVLTRAFTRYARSVGLHGLTFHDLRHDAGQYVDHGRCQPARSYGDPRTPGPADDDSISAPRSGAPRGRDAGARGSPQRPWSCFGNFVDFEVAELALLNHQNPVLS
jgi:integrase